MVGDDAPEVKKLEGWYSAHLRCEGLAQTLETLHTTASEEVDAHGRRSLRVKYEHSGATEGRLYAKSVEAISVTIPNEKPGRPPRTATLQGMINDARAPLVGATAYDIDAANSDFHLLLGFLERDGLEPPAPAPRSRVRQYVEHRREILDLIMQKHSVDEDTAKRLPNRLMNGGDYRQWLKENDLPERGDKVKAMVDLQEQMRNLRPKVFAHPRHKAYADSERVRVAREGRKKTDDAVDRAVFSSIVQRAEREMLLAAASSFFSAGWDILALIHDGFNAEPSPDLSGGVTPPLPLADALAKAETACHAIPGLRHVQLKEKPLHGLQDAPLKSLSFYGAHIFYVKG